MPLKEREQLARAVLHTFARYQDAERTTATARARTAKQFEQFMQPDNVRLFPNLKWLPSRSVDPRATHVPFYNHVWSKNDIFWNFNAPGTEWNCKCDVEETDEPVTDNSQVPVPDPNDEDYKKSIQGIEGNPAKTGEIFTDNASYIRIAGENKKWEIDGFWKATEEKRLCTDTSFVQNVCGQKPICQYEGTTKIVHIEPEGVDEALHASFGSPYFILKNYSLCRLEQIMKDAHCLGWRKVDLHNSKKSPKYKYKQDKDIFLYYQGKLPNGEPCFIHLCRNKYNGELFLYSFTTQLQCEDILTTKVP